MPPRPVEICLDCRVAPAEKKGRLAVCVDCRAAAAGAKSRCDTCRAIYYRRQSLTRRGAMPMEACPICSAPAVAGTRCETCARKIGGPKVAKRRVKARAIDKPEGWRNQTDEATAKPAGNAGRKVRTVRHLDSPEPDDPARASAVDAILARRRAMSAKGAR